MSSGLFATIEALRHPWRLPLSGAEPEGGVILAVGRVNGADERILRASLSNPLVVGPEVASMDQAEIAQMIQALTSGQNVAIFPEGTRGAPQVVHRGHGEAARLILAAKVPVVPVAIRLDQVENHRLIAPRYLLIGQPLDFSRYWECAASEELDGYLLRAIVDHLISEIVTMAQVDYRDRYLDPNSARLSLSRLEQLLDFQRRRWQASRQRRAELAAEAAVAATQEAELAAALEERQADDLARAAEAAEIHARYDAAVDEAARRARREQGQ